ncbi:methionyl-tRNA formyltransferase [Afifella marina]|uniref:Methionyl-tRNA formyltransferase n=1 Tax=Afifella marina DSM 2698 TaxID=1120955 RepID=A0A1G5NA35_AFIMA|nr:methionyl-tRNA formyltransferase [Afifella marina]MBK1623133.1 methionyl-tRNA formyltransferase [Afifella marina DSM 2698]MBK1626127.1 methionyl-tRNA formyltransferase [Afifella marina]MBK5917005.1 methionyl-tRNA formyltransferase [Afifella marina]RAI22005.1 methionyl-tRNA formyltransferase [Afifella marina DSM 2698]SCZ34285.1 methionyl-tRNA formyltransferase [Afifella marina DSM 2698]
MTLKVIFMGTPDFAVPTFLELVGQGHEVAAVYTQPPRPAGRGMAERKSPIHLHAERFGIPVRTPKSLKNEEAQAEFAALEADVAVVVAYGLILPKPVLDAPKDGCLNLHGSLLPRWRGAAPIQRAVMAGDPETGVMVMRMDEGLDTGPVCLAEKTPIGPDETTGQLHDRLARLGADLMVRALGALERGALTATPQAEEGITYASKIDKSEAKIDWSHPAGEVHNLIRGLSPFPGAWFEIEAGGKRERVKVLRSEKAEGSGQPGELLDGMTIACGEGAVRLVEVQRAGKQAMDANAALRGLPADFRIIVA